jgi:hypothetical protein
MYLYYYLNTTVMSRLNIITTEHWWKTGETEMSGAKPVQLPLCPPQISHGLTWNRTEATAKNYTGD